MIAAARAVAEGVELPPATIERFVAWLKFVDSVNADAELLARFIDTTPAEATRLGDALTERGVFDRRMATICSGVDCGIQLSNESVGQGTCQTCGVNLEESPPREQTRYLLERPRARDIGWVVAIHGIRTRGLWQEQLQWLIDRQFLRTVPFKNWKYGNISVRAMIPRLQRRFTHRFLSETGNCADQLHGVLRDGPAPPPDVIAHSFGTWVVAHALQDDQTLRLGRLVLIGSIVRPDWPWADMIDRGQIAGVLNYCGRRDLPVRLTQHVIPDSGPSGVLGFVQGSPRVVNVIDPNGNHSSVFKGAHLEAAFEDVWRPFLTARAENIDMTAHESVTGRPWSQAPLLCRAPALPLLILALVTGILAFAVTSIL